MIYFKYLLKLSILFYKKYHFSVISNIHRRLMERIYFFAIQKEKNINNIIYPVCILIQGILLYINLPGYHWMIPT